MREFLVTQHVKEPNRWTISEVFNTRNEEINRVYMNNTFNRVVVYQDNIPIGNYSDEMKEYGLVCDALYDGMRLIHHKKDYNNWRKDFGQI